MVLNPKDGGERGKAAGWQTCLSSFFSNGKFLRKELTFEKNAL